MLLCFWFLFCFSFEITKLSLICDSNLGDRLILGKRWVIQSTIENVKLESTWPDLVGPVIKLTIQPTRSTKITAIRVYHVYEIEWKAFNPELLKNQII